jgi:tetratricopeptide (TPR) repeat protein
MFSIYILFEHPKMFQAHFAISPYIMWDNNYTLNEAIKKFQNPINFQNYLFMTLGNEPPYVEPLGKFTDLLETNKPAGLEWHYTVMENDDHNTVPLKSMYEGLETLYKDWQIKVDVADRSINVVEDHYSKLSEKYGYKVEIPENVLNTLGYRAIGREKFELAIEFFLHNVNLYPESANVYDSLGEGYEAAGKLDLARKNYQIAVKKGTESADNNLAIYKEHLDNVTKKLNSAKS